MVKAKNSLENVIETIANGMPEDFMIMDLTDAYEALGEISGETLEEDIIDLIPQVQAKTLSTDFLEQLDAVEKLYGQKLHFDFNGQIIETLLKEEKFYSTDIKIRVRDIILQQRRSYQYLFS